jgi:hypothetical protein
MVCTIDRAKNTNQEKPPKTRAGNAWSWYICISGRIECHSQHPGIQAFQPEDDDGQSFASFTKGQQKVHGNKRFLTTELEGSMQENDLNSRSFLSFLRKPLSSSGGVGKTPCIKSEWNLPLTRLPRPDYKNFDACGDTCGDAEKASSKGTELEGKRWEFCSSRAAEESWCALFLQKEGCHG